MLIVQLTLFVIEVIKGMSKLHTVFLSIAFDYIWIFETTVLLNGCTNVVKGP